MNKVGTTILFNSFVLSVITYAVEFRWPLLTEQEKQMFQRVIKKAIRNNIIPSYIEFQNIAQTRMRNLFTNVVENPDHILHVSLPMMSSSERRRGIPIVAPVTTVREQKTFMNYMALLINRLL